MLYALIASNVAWAACLAFCVSRGLAAYRQTVALNDARETKLREKALEREDQLLNRIQAPQVAVAQSMPDPEPGFHVSHLDDEALAEEEAERFKIRDGAVSAVEVGP